MDTAPSHAEIEASFETNGELTASGRGPRKVLADLDSNDSPIVGFIPSVTNCPFEYALGSQTRRTEFFSPAEKRNSLNTQLGENLLRSQVKRLLQKVDANVPTLHKPAPSLRSLCHLQNFMDSPALKIVAPTPINTPCIDISACLQPFAATLSTSNSSMSDNSEKTQNFLQEENEQEKGMRNILHAEKRFLDSRVSSEPSLPECIASGSLHSKPFNVAQNSRITITESVLPGLDRHNMQITPLISTAHLQADFLGKKTTRILQFDSPDKVVATPNLSSLNSPIPEQHVDGSFLVNVSSPDQISGRDIEADLIHGRESENEQNAHVRKAGRRGTPFPKGSTSWRENVDDDGAVSDDDTGDCIDKAYNSEA